MIVHTRTRENNINGRLGTIINSADGVVGHLIEIVGKDIVLSSLEGKVLETNRDLHSLGDFVARQIVARSSKLDGRLVVYCFGFDAGSANSRAVVVKLNTVVG